MDPNPNYHFINMNLNLKCNKDAMTQQHKTQNVGQNT